RSGSPPVVVALGRRLANSAPRPRVEWCAGVIPRGEIVLAITLATPYIIRRRRRRHRRPRELPFCRSWRIVTEPLPPFHAGRIASLGNRESFAKRTLCQRPSLPTR